MNTAIVMLGSNMDAENNLQTAKEILSENFEIVRESSVQHSKPHGKTYKADFQNKALILLSAETESETISAFKDIETAMGRDAESKRNGLVPIDIDLIFWNEKLVHPDYDRFDFVRKCIAEIM